VRILPLPPLSPASKLLQPLTLVAALVVVLLLSSPGWANSCSTITLSVNGPPVNCTIPETTPEPPLISTLTGLSFTTQAQGMVLIFDDASHTMLSDVVAFTNVNGVATVTFLSDTDLTALTGLGLPILGQFTESSYLIPMSLALGNGNFLNVLICSDVEGGTCYGASDCIRMSQGTTAIPEPGTFLLLGSGLFGSGALKLSAGSLRRRLLKWRHC
jgi:hypothetical protein